MDTLSLFDADGQTPRDEDSTPILRSSRMLETFWLACLLACPDAPLVSPPELFIDRSTSQMTARENTRERVKDG